MGSQENRDRRLKIGLLDFEPLRVAGFKSVFEQIPEVDAYPVTLAEALETGGYDILLIGMRDTLVSFDLMGRIKERRPGLKLIVMGSESDSETIINAIACGAKGYLEETASPEQVMQAIEVVQSGSIWAPRKVLSLFVDRMLQASSTPVRRPSLRFTDRERQVLRLLVAARSNREIATVLRIEERTVKAHVARLMRKVGVDNRIALSIHAATRALVSTEDE